MDKISETFLSDGSLNLYKERATVHTPKISEHNEFYFVVSGEVKFNVANEIYLATAGQVVCMPALKLYGYSFDEGEVWRLTCAERYLAEFYDCYPNSFLPYFLTDVKFNKKAFSLLREEINLGDATEFEKRVAFNSFIARVIANYSVVKKEFESDSQISEIVNYINKNYDKDITLDFLAKEFCVSKMVLSRKLSKHLGVDLRRFISDVRIKEFVKLRREKQNEGVSSVELAYRCGFRSYETFYRTYRRYLGDKV